MATLIAPPHTEDGADGAHFQQDGLAHGAILLLGCDSCSPRCPTSAGQGDVPLKWDKAECYGAAAPIWDDICRISQRARAGSGRAYAVRSGAQPPLPGAAWRTPTTRPDLPHAALPTPAGC